MNPRVIWELIKDAGSEWIEDKAPRLGAALAYYTIFSIAPLLLIAIAVAGFVFGREAVEGQLYHQINDLVGAEGGAALQSLIAAANRPAAGTVATILGVLMLILGATGLFGQLQDALNTIWDVEVKPGRGIWGFVKDRFLSFSMVLGCAFLLLVSLFVSAFLSAMGGFMGWEQVSIIGRIIDFAVSFAVITGLFAMIYKFLPDVIIAWRDVWFGAAFTALLFTFGKWLIGLYIGQSSVSSAYGAFGSLAVLLIWLYYSSQIFLFGAELTKAYADKFGSRVVPSENAVSVEKREPATV